MLKTLKPLLAAATVLSSGTAFAADFYEPPVIEAPPPPQIIEREVSYGGWYIRGDVDYHWSDLRGANYYTSPPIELQTFDTAELKGAMSLGAGAGYKFTKYLRADLTADYWFKADFNGSTSGTCGAVPCTSTDSTAFSALLLMANAYVDLGTYHGVTPYVGAGIGGARIKWDDLENTIGGTTTVHEGNAEWRFAWALMAGASYCLTNNLELDAGYRFSRISEGRMFGIALGAGPGFDEGFNVHEARAGLRYSFGENGSANCATPQVVAYEPPPVYEPPVYK
ncbi:outer membrane protein [Nitratireductor luteus]|uniref:outer membrane protein n=1 Tax=Nitratireductor luteus TaxID=2976980 RepID=UPI00223FB888|nr:outer membrane protein [Nitratireductor luteus]